MKRKIVVEVCAVVNAKGECTMFDIGKSRGSILPNSFHLYFLKLHSCNYTLPPLIKRRNRGVIFLFLHSLHSSPRYFWGKSSARAHSRAFSWFGVHWLKVKPKLNIKMLYPAILLTRGEDVPFSLFQIHKLMPLINMTILLWFYTGILWWGNEKTKKCEGGIFC